MRAWKLLIVAGSSAYFGISAQSIERATGIRSINLGMQAGLSFDLITDLLKDRLKAGDVVLVRARILVWTVSK